MKIFLFISNSRRHKFLANSLSENFDVNCFIFKKKINRAQNIYFKTISKIERKYFPNNKFKKKVKIFNETNPEKIIKIIKKKKSIKNLFIVFGYKIIKDRLLRFLKQHDCLNLHAGISPYYRGVACNPWAIYDQNFDLIGCTMLELDKKIDGGRILFHIKPKKLKKNLKEISMHALKVAIKISTNKINNQNILDFKRIKQNHQKEIRFSKSKDFDQKIIKEFFKINYKIKINQNKRAFHNLLKG